MSKNTDLNLPLQSPDLTQHNIDKIAELFPNCVTEGPDGKVVDFDLLRQELSPAVVEGQKERYRLEWPGKREAIVTANLPTTKTLRPVREDSVDFDTTENLYIEGDNLEVLKLLQESYLGMIKMIYIDPPYNTGKDFVYKDNFHRDAAEELLESGQKDEYNQRLVVNPETSGRYHSDWLSMMYPRLKLARNLLKEDGLIMVSIDNNEVENLKKILDEIFGEINHIETLIWKKKYGGGAKTKYYVNLHEYIIVFARNIATINSIAIPYDDDTIRRYYKFQDDKFSIRGPYRLQPLATNSNDIRPNLRYPIKYNNQEVWPDKQWQWSKERTTKALEKGEIVFVEGKSKISVNFKQYLKDEDGEIRDSKPTSMIDGIYTQHGTNEVKTLFGDGQIFSFPKPIGLIEQIATPFLNNDDIFLDFFSGSSSSANAIIELNAKTKKDIKFINIQIPENILSENSDIKDYNNICDLARERIRRAAKKIKEETGADIDYGFRVYRLDSSNMQDVNYRPQEVQQNNLALFSDNVKSDRTADDLLAQVMLAWGLPLSLRIERNKVAGKEVMKVDKDALFACFDDGIDESFAREIAKEKPLRIVFRDSGFADDTAKINVQQLLRQLSPETEMKVI